MIGFLLGIGFLIGLPGMALDHSASEDGAWIFAGVAIFMLIASWVVGMILVRTVGIAAVGYTVGAFVAAIISLFNGQVALVLPWLLHAAVGVLVGNGQRIRMGGLE